MKKGEVKTVLKRPSFVGAEAGKVIEHLEDLIIILNGDGPFNGLCNPLVAPDGLKSAALRRPRSGWRASPSPQVRSSRVDSGGDAQESLAGTGRPTGGTGTCLLGRGAPL